MQQLLTTCQYPSTFGIGDRAYSITHCPIKRRRKAGLSNCKLGKHGSTSICQPAGQQAVFCDAAQRYIEEVYVDVYYKPMFVESVTHLVGAPEDCKLRFARDVGSKDQLDWNTTGVPVVFQRT